MQATSIQSLLCEQLRVLVAENLGLNFPLERNADLWRGLTGTAKELEFEDAVSCAESLLAGPVYGPQLDALAAHLTVGETYFFRERAAFDALASEVLPQLIHSRRERGQRLRFWSAACSTGEEAYSLAILLRQVLPDIKDWLTSILATDVNARSLRKAAAGVYGKWSFRNCPPEFQERHFWPVTQDQFAVRPEIRSLVSFGQLNLAKEVFPSAATNTTSMDIIFCRNILIYFTPTHAQRLINKLRAALSPDGWLIVSPSECSQTLFSEFKAVNFPNAILYQKTAVRTPRPQPVVISARERPPIPFEPTAAANDAIAREPEPSMPIPALTRKLANEGRLSEALVWSKQWLNQDKLNATAHYLHATISQELGESETARKSLQRSIFLQPDFALAHFTLGTLARRQSRHREARRHFENALDVLRVLSAESVLPESDGITASQLGQMIADLLEPTPCMKTTQEQRTS